MRIGYVLNKYPAISNTFMLREVLALRREGVDVHTFSIHKPQASELLSDVDRREASNTPAVLPVRPLVMARAHLRALTCSPRRYFSTLRYAVANRSIARRGFLWQLFYFTEAIVVWAWCDRRGIRHLHAHFSYVACDATMLACHFGSGVSDQPWSYSFTVHGPVEFYDLPLNRMAKKASQADLVVAISHFARSQVLAMLPQSEWQKVQIVHCGLERGSFVPAGDARTAADSPFHVLNVGRLVGVKAQAVLIEAISELVGLGVDARATIIGEGENRAALEELATRLGMEDRIHLAGAVGQDDIRAYFDRADAFCLPSFAEGLPVVIMEAMASGLPVVSTAIMGIPEIVEDGVTGLLVEPANVSALTAALQRLALDPAEAQRYAKAARQRIEDDFDVDRSARELSAHFSSMPGASG